MRSAVVVKADPVPDDAITKLRCRQSAFRQTRGRGADGSLHRARIAAFPGLQRLPRRAAARALPPPRDTTDFEIGTGSAGTASGSFVPHRYRPGRAFVAEQD